MSATRQPARATFRSVLDNVPQPATFGALAVVFFAATSVGIRALGIRPVFPWPLLLSLVLVVLPVAFVVAGALRAVERAGAARPVVFALVPAAMAAICFGWQLVTSWRGTRGWASGWWCCWPSTAPERRTSAGSTGGRFASCLLCGYLARELRRPVAGSRPARGYRPAAERHPHLRSARHRRLVVSGRVPFVTGPVFTLLEQSYMFLLPELMVVLFLVAGDDDAAQVLPRVMLGVAACYVYGYCVPFRCPAVRAMPVLPGLDRPVNQGDPDFRRDVTIAHRVRVGPHDRTSGDRVRLLRGLAESPCCARNARAIGGVEEAVARVDGPAGKSLRSPRDVPVGMALSNRRRVRSAARHRRLCRRDPAGVDCRIRGSGPSRPNPSLRHQHLVNLEAGEGHHGSIQHPEG